VGKKIVDALRQQAGIVPEVVEESEAVETFQKPEPPEPKEFFQQPEIQYSQDEQEIDIPANVAVLKQLMAKLPPGITKHTGAQIIRQTMEALGIPMKSVLQEAQAFQDSLTDSVEECQENIAEYKRQINTMEAQTKKLQKLSASLNDIISLFVQLEV
jgi:ABC-type transporter Mla subunit MlaD